MVRLRIFRRRQTSRAFAPINDLRLIDSVSRIRRRGQARRIAHRAVDVDRLPARAANEMVVIISDAILKASRRPRRLNPPDQPLLCQHPEGVVHRLPRNGSNLSTNLNGHIIRRRMRPAGYRPQHSHTLGCDLETISPQKFGGILEHRGNLAAILDSVKNWTNAIFMELAHQNLLLDPAQNGISRAAALQTAIRRGPRQTSWMSPAPARATAAQSAGYTPPLALAD
jgi:hypothetical protein